MSNSIKRTPEDQAAMLRTREAGEQLKRDALAVVWWLDAMFPGLLVSLEIQRHYSCEDCEIAHVEPRVTDRTRRHEVRYAAEKALEAIGWVLHPEGRDVRSSVFHASRSQSAHLRLAEIARVQKAVDEAPANSQSEQLARLSNFAFLDFEASSLSLASWPVEVGLSWLEDGDVRTWSSLIRPHSDWDIGDWSPQSAKVHGIALSDLKTAPSTSEVAATFYEMLGNRTLVSDAPVYEARWLLRLISTSEGHNVPRIADFDRVSFGLFSGYALDMLYETLERRPAPHRAGPDTARLALGWQKAAEHQASLLSEGIDACPRSSR